MVVRKRNQYLEGSDSEDEYAAGRDSEDEETGRGGLGGPGLKRRKISPDSDQDSNVDDEDGGVAIDDAAQAADAHRFALGSDFDDEDHVIGDDEDDDNGLAAIVSAKKGTPKAVLRAEKAARRSGVIYISRVPPFMKPQTLRHFLAPHASKGLGRVFLTPEDQIAHQQRVKRGGNKKKSFTDGWVEFTSKTEAKVAAEMLNGNIIGGKKGNFYHDDLWNIKYLKGFKWSHLTDQIASENAERAARLREEVRRTKEENKAFVEDIEKGKMLEGMESKRKARRQKGLSAAVLDATKSIKPGREFKQRKARDKDERDPAGHDEKAELRKVMNSVL